MNKIPSVNLSDFLSTDANKKQETMDPISVDSDYNTYWRKFNSGFTNPVRLYFIDIFRSLFSEEDNADLILLEPDNPLESKIEIVPNQKVNARNLSVSFLEGKKH